MKYNTKLECAKYLNDKYGQKCITNLMKQKEKGFDNKNLGIIKNEYDIFFENMYNNIKLDCKDKKIQNYIKEFAIFLDLVYSNSREVLKIYAGLFKSEKVYIDKLNSLDAKLGDFVVSAINEYLK